MVVVTLWETFGWLSVAAAVIGLWALLILWRALRRASRRNLGALRLLGRGIVVMIVVAAVLTPFVPMWTLAPFADLNGLIDILTAFGMALVPAAVVAVIWIYFGSLRKARKAF